MSVKIVAKNRNARRNYEISETFEAGMVLLGSEVKALREAKITLQDAYARFEDGELWLVGLHITTYSSASTHTETETKRKRKLLMHRTELDRISAKADQNGLTLVPISIYFKEGRAKLEFGLGKGLKVHDKRQAIAKRDSDREARRELAHKNKY